MKYLITLISALMLMLIAIRPAGADVIISGIMDALPSDRNPFFEFDYKAIEFYTDTAIATDEMETYRLRAEFLQFGAVMTTNYIPFQAVAAAADTFFYAPAPNVGPLQELYEGGTTNNLTDGWEANPRLADPFASSFVLTGGPGGGVFHSGDVQYFLEQVDGSNVTVIDQVGDLNLVGAGYGVFSWAYRRDTAIAGEGFDPNEWRFGSDNELLDITVAEVSERVPFGTFMLPEPSGAGLLVFGFALVWQRCCRVHRRRS